MSNKIKNWYIMGDPHGSLYAMHNVPCDQDENAAVIILGDVGLNYYLNKTDTRKKDILNTSTKCTYYCLRGNHEERPQNLPNIQKVYDEEVCNWVYVEPQYPRIKYFLDYGVYMIGKYRTAIIGGAYSVDKWYRILRAGLTEENNDPKRSGWFPEEQLTLEERLDASILFTTSPKFDLVMSHTAPMAYRPYDCFLPMIDQKTVDTTMEDWLQKLAQKIEWKYVWLMGHYHVDRIEAPHFEYYYEDVENLEDIVHRWQIYNATGILEAVRERSPFYRD